MRSGLDSGLLLLAVVALAAWYLSYTAARLDRLHARVEGTLSALDAQLVRRAEATLELANSGALDPATALLLASAAVDSIEAGDSLDARREAIESDLSEAIAVALAPAFPPAQESGSAGSALLRAGGAAGPVGESVGPAALRRVLSAGQRVQLARRFHNDAVTDVRRVRRKAVVRLFRLAGHAELPRTVEFDDALPGAAPPA